MGNVFKFEKETRTLVMFITVVLFMILAWTSYTVESKYCVYTTDFLCTTVESQEVVMALVCLLFMVISMLYLIMDFLGKIPQPTQNFK